MGFTDSHAATIRLLPTWEGLAGSPTGEDLSFLGSLVNQIGAPAGDSSVLSVAREDAITPGSESLAVGGGIAGWDLSVSSQGFIVSPFAQVGLDYFARTQGRLYFTVDPDGSETAGDIVLGSLHASVFPLPGQGGADYQLRSVADAPFLRVEGRTDFTTFDLAVGGVYVVHLDVEASGRPSSNPPVSVDLLLDIALVPEPSTGLLVLLGLGLLPARRSRLRR